MTQFLVNIPDQQIPFFKELIEKLGFEISSNDLQDWQKEILDERIKMYEENPSNVTSFRDAMNEIKNSRK